MRIRFLSTQLAITMLAATSSAVLAGCASERDGTAFVPENPIAVVAAQRKLEGSSSRFKSLYSFWSSPSDGAYPIGDLVSLHGILYGVTLSGGSGKHGTAFYLTPKGQERVLHNFTEQSDGGNPWGGLVDVNGTLFGTTALGGLNGRGVVYKLVDARHEQVVYNFGVLPGDDGNEPHTPMLYVDGSLYGTTYRSSSGSCGTLFKLAPTGKSIQMVHEFEGYDGCNPTGLLYVNGTFYGATTSEGNSPAPYGTLFSLSPSGDFHTVYTFGPEPDAQVGGTLLVDVGGDVYGTGGGGYDYGAIFRFSPATGKEKVIYRFTGQKGDGIYPGGLVVFHGVLFGWTGGGGAHYRGRLFRITTGGSLTFLHAFNGTDGSDPIGNMTVLNDVLYGATSAGGLNGFGNVFSLKP